jgi:membrane-associated protease RseP (regulator of RpoE activity)
VTVVGRWIFYVLFAAVLVSFLFVAPGRTTVMTHTMPKVDVSIRGLSPLTSRYFLIQVAEYERSYTFYVPTEQTILKVPREQVEYVMFKQDVSPFADRSLFRKGSWLGVRGQWKLAPGSRVTEAGGAIGFEVAAVDAGSSASGAGIAPGDVLVELDGIRLDGSLELAAVAALGLPGKPATLLVSRGGKPLTLRLQLEQAR